MISHLRRSLAAKLIVVISLVLVTILLINGVVVLSRVASNSEEQAIAYMEALSGEYARVAQALMEVPLDHAVAAASLMAAYDNIPEGARRTVYIDFLKSLIEKHPEYLSVWTLWEPDALDGRDEMNIGKSGNGSDAKGIFTPLIYLENGRARLTEPAPDAQAAYGEPFYLGAKESMKEYVTEPYLYPMDGEQVLMISMVAPIIRDGRFMGVVGIDITPERLQEQLDQLSLYDSGFGRLISHEGTVVTHPYPDRIGKMAPEWKEMVPEIEVVIETGNINTFLSVSLATGQETVKSFVPVRLGKTTRPWYFGTVVPPGEVYADTRRVVAIYIIGTILGLLAMVVIIWLLMQSFLKPLKKASRALADVAQGEGDLTRHLEVRTGDEVGKLSGHFNTFVESLSGIIAGIQRSVEALKNSGQDLSANMEETGSAVYAINANIDSVQQQIINQSAGVTEVSSTIEEISRNVESLDRLVERQGNALESSSASIEEMVANIHSVTRNVESNLSQVDELNRISEKGYGELQDVTSRIREIADQSEGLMEANQVIQGISARTNLLAMNAAIEAAHAGAAGRGFAVVADEIRKLAETSNSQTRQISQVLGSLKELIDLVVNKVIDAGNSFEKVRMSVQDVRSRQGEIRSSMEEQSSGSRQVLESLEELRNISHEVQSGSGEMATGSKAILEEMQQLMRITQEVQNSVEEMIHGTGEINSAISAVVEMTQENSNKISAIEEGVGKFTI